MKGYELLYIVGTQYTDKDIVDIQEKIHHFLEEAGAHVLKSEGLGKIRLAYPIKKIRHGSYILTYFDAEPSIIADLNRRLALHEELLRHTLLVQPAGALERTFELTSYIAPLSEEAKSEREIRRGPARTFKKTVPQRVSPPSVSVKTPPMTMEELDKTLDKILEDNIAEQL